MLASCTKYQQDLGPRENVSDFFANLCGQFTEHIQDIRYGDIASVSEEQIIINYVLVV
jgi:hypothetical protein